jgi:hypothetical protein
VFRFSNRLNFLAVALAVLVGSPAVHGESFKERLKAHPPAERAAALAAIMQEKLSLSPDQASAVEMAAEKYALQTDEALDQYKKRELRKQLKEIGVARDAEFEKILSAEQFQLYKKDKREVLKAMRSSLEGSQDDAATASQS